ncbi:MAG: NAD(P)-dependent oxidoreductase [Naasia sp.]|nr:NAD(P)-dependent oxidoreductase [Naasia sp.]
MTIAVTGATGHLGRLIIDALQARGVPAGGILALGRNTDRLAELAEVGLRTAAVEYDDRAALNAALAGVDTLMLVSGTDLGRRVEQHRNVVEAARAGGASRVVYTSGPHADTSPLSLMVEHRGTEAMLAEAGLPFTVLRNNWYTENYGSVLDQAERTGQYVASTGEGRVASANRAHYAEAAAVVLTTDGHEGRTYELAGDYAWNGSELAAALSAIVGREIVYVPLTTEQHISALITAGLDEGSAAFVAGMDAAIREGALADASGDLSRLIGRPTVPLLEGLRAAAGR